MVDFGNKVFHEVPLIQTAQTEINGIKTPLLPLGHALYSKYFFNVYVIQFLASNPVEYDYKKNFKLDPMEAMAIRVTFLLSLDGDIVYSHLKEALEYNGVDVSRKNVENCLKAIPVSIKKGDSFFFIGKKLFDDVELVEVYIPHLNKFFKISEQELIWDMFSIWLGNVSYDASLSQMQKQLFTQFELF